MLALALDALQDRGDRAQDVPGGRVLEVALHDASDTPSQVAGQCGFDRRPQLARGDDRHALERAAPMGARQEIGDVAHVGADLLLDATLEAGLRPPALGVPAVDILVEGGELDQRVSVAAKQPRRPPADHRHTPGLPSDRGDKRLEPRHRVDDGHRINGLGDPYDLEVIGADHGEDRQSPGVAHERRVRIEELLHAIDGGVELLRSGSNRLWLPTGQREQSPELGVACRGRRKPSGVEIKVHAQHGQPARPQPGEALQGVGSEVTALDRGRAP